MVEDLEYGWSIYVHLGIHGEQLEVCDVLIDIAILYLQLPEFVLCLLLNCVVNECLFKVLFDYLPDIFGMGE
jgi:hypothetical protein